MSAIKNLIKENGWKEFPDGSVSSLKELPMYQNIFKYDAWRIGYYKGDVKNPTEVIVVSDDGPIYKVGAQWMIWYKNQSTKGELYSRATFTTKTHEKILKEVIKGNTAPTDPNYRS